MRRRRCVALSWISLRSGGADAITESLPEGGSEFGCEIHSQNWYHADMRRLVLLSGLVGLLALVGCSSAGGGSNATGIGATGTTVAGPPCPVAPVPVVASVDQWGSIAR